jgi:hypothetical protein
VTARLLAPVRSPAGWGLAAEDEKPERARLPRGVPDLLKPCSNVIYGDYYRAVLRRVTETWSREGRGVTFYELYSKERVLRSKNELKIVLDTLTNCGYLVCRKGRARTNSPLGRKEYYPTPLGALMNTTLSLLDLLEGSPPPPPDSLRAALTYVELAILVENTLYDAVPTAYIATVLSYPQPQLPPYIISGRYTVSYTIDLLVTKILEESEGSPEEYREPTLREIYMEHVERGIRKALENIREKKRLEEHLDWRAKVFSQEKPDEEEEIVRKALDILESTFKLIMKLVEVHGKTESASQATSSMS